MRSSVFLLVLAASANASWFSSDDKPEYNNWDTQKLHHWLESNSIHVPDSYSKSDLQKLVAENWESHKPWTTEMYEAAKARYQDVEASAFDSWDESRLRNFLLEQGIVQPKSTREQLVLAAKKQYNSYTNAASSLSSQASTAVYGKPTDQASKSVTSAYYEASASATSLAAEASKSAASAYATASAFASAKMDDSKDYVYSTWDDNRLRTYLEEKGVIRTKQQVARDEMLAKMQGVYNSATDPIYNSWSDSYMKRWLVAHGIIRSDAEKKRDEYTALLKSYYYGPQDKVWSTWSDSELKAWLVKNNIVKSDAQIQREKAESLIAKNYYNAKDSAWSAWSDNSMKTWLIDHGYMRSDAQVKRDEMIKLMQDKYNDASGKTADYLTWPDARLRAYLRSWGVDDTKYGSRPTLLQEVRIRYYQANNKVEQLLAAIREAVWSSVEGVESKLHQVLDMLTGAKNDAKAYGSEKQKQASAYGNEKVKQASEYSTEKQKQAAKVAEDKAASAEAAAASLKDEAAKKRQEL